MENDCIVCAKSFHDPNMERITCSKECCRKWNQFLKELKTIPQENKKAFQEKFLENMYRKMMFRQLSEQE